VVRSNEQSDLVRRSRAAPWARAMKPGTSLYVDLVRFAPAALTISIEHPREHDLVLSDPSMLANAKQTHALDVMGVPVLAGT
jgi:hypothetical protein